MNKLRRLDSEKIKALREAKGLTLQEAADRVGVYLTNYQKWESGAVERAKESNMRSLARVLDVHIDEISEPPAPTDLEAWAYHNNYSIITAQMFVREGRIEGAYKDEKGHWVVEKDAKRLPPTEMSRALWRSQQPLRTRYQRRRRARLRGEHGTT